MVDEKRRWEKTHVRWWKRERKSGGVPPPSPERRPRPQMDETGHTRIYIHIYIFFFPRRRTHHGGIVDRSRIAIETEDGASQFPVGVGYLVPQPRLAIDLMTGERTKYRRHAVMDRSLHPDHVHDLAFIAIRGDFDQRRTVVAAAVVAAAAAVAVAARRMMGRPENRNRDEDVQGCGRETERPSRYGIERRETRGDRPPDGSKMRRDGPTEPPKSPPHRRRHRPRRGSSRGRRRRSPRMMPMMPPPPFPRLVA